MSAQKILIVDSDPRMRRCLSVSLTATGHAVVEAASGEEALRKLDSESCDFVVLDLDIPAMGRTAICRAIRAVSDVPVLVFSSRGSEQDKVAALKVGADDYVTKPFSLPELLARVEAVARRRPAMDRARKILVLDDIRISFENRQVSAQGRQEHLTPKEFEVLRYMAVHKGEILPHRRLLQAVWGPDHGNEIEYLRVVMNQLRKKIEPDPHNPKYLLTEPWVGYRLALPSRHRESP